MNRRSTIQRPNGFLIGLGLTVRSSGTPPLGRRAGSVPWAAPLSLSVKPGEEKKATECPVQPPPSCQACRGGHVSAPWGTTGRRLRPHAGSKTRDQIARKSHVKVIFKFSNEPSFYHSAPQWLSYRARPNSTLKRDAARRPACWVRAVGGAP